MLLAWAAIVAVALNGGCSASRAISASTTPAPPQINIDKVSSVKTSFGPDFAVQTIGQTAIDPKLLSPVQFQQGLTWDPTDCAKYAWTLPSGLKGNIATVSAQGQGNRFIAMAIETSQPVRYDPAVVDKCRHVTFSGSDVHGVVDVVDSPHVDGAQTLGKHRELQTTVGSGELYTYVAYLDDYLVVVTANPLPIPNQPVPQVNIQRAQQLLTDAVAAVRS
ncbi:MAG: DUF5642 family protein [Mycobacteriaceae bacterium]|nr:DUF5642 family protein [Mycobacteriaceae bacterium]